MSTPANIDFCAPFRGIAGHDRRRGIPWPHPAGYTRSELRRYASLDAASTGARESTRVFLKGLADPVAAEAADTVVLVVRELVTNALRHGGGTGGFGWPFPRSPGPQRKPPRRSCHVPERPAP